MKFYRSSKISATDLMGPRASLVGSTAMKNIVFWLVKPLLLYWLLGIKYTITTIKSAHDVCRMTESRQAWRLFGSRPLNEPLLVNTLRPRQNGRHFPDDIFKCIILNENVWIPIKISLKFVPKGPINNIPAMVQIMAWRRSGDKPLSETMVVIWLTHICVTRPQWVNRRWGPNGNSSIASQF